MIKSITARNYLGKEITLELARPEKSGLLVASIEGLGPAKATINVTDISTGDGGVFNSSRLDKRNIVMKLYFLQSASESIEDVRQKTYVYFPIKKKVYLTIVTDNHTLKTEGYVESNEPDIFSPQESCQISIICPDPLFYSPVNETTNFNGVESSFAFPFANDSLGDPLLEMGVLQNRTEQLILYDGNSEIGMTIHIHSLGKARNITIMNNITGEKMILNTDKLSSILASPEISYPYYSIGVNEEIEINSIYTYQPSSALRDNGDGTLSLYQLSYNGHSTTAAEDTVFYLTPPANSSRNGLLKVRDGSYTFSCCPEGGSTSTYYVELRTLDENCNVVATYTDTGAGVTFDADTYVEICIRVVKVPESTGIPPVTFAPKFARQDEGRLITGDTLVITTSRGEKGITLSRDGVTTNILNCLEKGSKWFTLTKGDNIFSYDAEVGASNLQFYIENKVAYDGV